MAGTDGTTAAQSVLAASLPIETSLCAHSIPPTHRTAPAVPTSSDIQIRSMAITEPLRGRVNDAMASAGVSGNSTAGQLDIKDGPCCCAEIKLAADIKWRVSAVVGSLGEG